MMKKLLVVIALAAVALLGCACSEKTFYGIEFKDAVFYYDGCEHSLAAENLPAGAFVRYEGNGKTEIGEYTVTATVEQKGYKTLVLTAVLKILPPEICGVTLESAVFEYDGEPFSLQVNGLQEGMSVTYSGNGRTEIGEYAVEATVAKEGFSDLILNATLTIVGSSITNYTYHFFPGCSETVSYAKGETVTPPVQPKREFYLFGGWFEDSAGEGGEFAFGQADADKVLYAKWNFGPQFEKIGSREEFLNMKTDGKYYLTCDVDLSGEYSKAVIGGRFTGILDGNGHTVSGFTVQNQSAYAGLFEINAGLISRLTVKNAYAKGRDYAGLIVAFNSAGGTVADCTAEGKAESEYAAGGVAGGSEGSIFSCGSAAEIVSARYAGGLLGINWGEVEDCFADCSVKVINDTQKESFAGGLVGSNYFYFLNTLFYPGTVTGCFARSDIYVEHNTSSPIVRCYIGGLCGTNYDSVKDSAAECTVVAISPNGRIMEGTAVGFNMSAVSVYGEVFSGRVENCYYSLNSAFQSAVEADGAVGLEAFCSARWRKNSLGITPGGRVYRLLENI